MLLLCELNAGIAFAVGYILIPLVFGLSVVIVILCVDDVVVRSLCRVEIRLACRYILIWGANIEYACQNQGFLVCIDSHLFINDRVTHWIVGDCNWLHRR